MKQRTSHLLAFALAGLLGNTLNVLSADTYTWNVTGAGTHIWGTNVNWMPTSGFPGTNTVDPAVADFQVDIAANQTIGIAKALGTTAAAKDLIAHLSVLKVGDTSGTNSYTFTKGGANAARIHFNNPGGLALFEKRGDGNDSFTPGAFRLITDLNIVFAGGSGSLTLGAAINEQTAGAQHVVNVSGPGQLILSGTANADFGGGIRVSESTLTINGDQRLGAVPVFPAPSNIQLSSNAQLLANGSVSLNSNRGVLIKGGNVKLGTIDAGNILTVENAVTGDALDPATLEIVGPGTVVLLGGNNYAGDTAITGGKLFLTSNHQSLGGFNVSDGAGFGIRAVTPFTAPTFTALRLGNGGATTLDFDVGALGSQMTEMMAVLDLVPNGTVTVNVAGNSLIPGQFTLVVYGNLGGSGASSFKLGSLPPGVIAQLVDTGYSLVLDVQVVVSEITWWGGLSADWDIGLSANWNSGFATYTEYGPATNRVGDFVRLDDTAAGHTSINLTTDVRPVRFTADNTNVNYTLSGAGSLQGAGTLTKSGAGTLTLSVSNTMTGGSTLNGGLLLLGHDQALGPGPLALNGGGLASDSATPRTIANPVTILIATTLGDVTSTGPLTFTSPIDFAGGARSITVNSDVLFDAGGMSGRLGQKLGPGHLMVRGSNYWTGGATEVRNGLLTLEGDFTFGDALRVMADVDAGTSRAVLTPGSKLLINLAGSNLRIGHEGSSYSNGTNILDISGAVTFIATSTAGNIQLGSDSRFAQVNLRSGGSVATRSVGRGTQTPADGEQEFNFDGGKLIAIATSSTFIQNLTRVNILAGGATIDSAGFTLDIAQPLLDGGGNGGFTKLGGGLLRLHGTNTYTGTTTVKEGRLAGRGIISGPVVVEATGEISAGPDPVTMTINNSLDLNGTYFVEVSRSSGSPASDRLVGITTFNIAGPLTVTLLGTTALQAGDTFDLFDAATINGTFTATNLPALDPGLAWDTAQLYPDGIIRVVLAPSNPTLNPPVYTATDITLSGTGGTPNAAFRVLSSNDVAAPLASWTEAGTGNFDGSGGFSVTLPVTTGEAQRFYVIVSP